VKVRRHLEAAIVDTIAGGRSANLIKTMTAGYAPELTKAEYQQKQAIRLWVRCDGSGRLAGTFRRVDVEQINASPICAATQSRPAYLAKTPVYPARLRSEKRLGEGTADSKLRACGRMVRPRRLRA
jgi:hypothetical protein